MLWRGETESGLLYTRLTKLSYDFFVRYIYIRKTCNYDAYRVKYTGQYSVSEFMPLYEKKISYKTTVRT